MNLEGRIDVAVHVTDLRVAEVAINSSRPQFAQRLMAGHTPSEVADLAGTLFSLCGRAQRIAALAACAAAAGEPPEDETARDYERRILAEWAREHAWRLLLDWPEVAGHNPVPASLQDLYRAGEAGQPLAEVLDALLTDVLLDEPATVWLDRGAHGFDNWLQTGNGLATALFATCGDGRDPAANDTRYLPPLADITAPDVADLARQALAVPAFCGRPLWQGEPAETGPLARCATEPLVSAWVAGRGAGAGARLLARLTELARLPGRLAGTGPAVLRAWPLADDTGVAAVETSRGLLLHVVRLDEGRVSEYRIVSPTEWNFHPAGPLAKALIHLPVDDRLATDAKRVVLAFDPCVEYGVEIAYA